MAPSTLLEKVWREAFFISNWQRQCHPFPLSGFVSYYRKFINSQDTVNIPNWQFLHFHASNISKLQLLTPDLHFYPAAAAAADLEKVSTCFCFGDTPEALGCPHVSINVFLLSDLCSAQCITEITWIKRILVEFSHISIEMLPTRTVWTGEMCLFLSSDSQW